ncbi:MAG TPA: alpha/beta fold hydrolase [Terracidiphilus sp.]|nr:alpha/beta fold hydrolase [Terracidiphilus sp.]
MTAPSTVEGPAQQAGRSALRSLFIPGPAGRLESLLNEGAPEAQYAALICHPHPKGGGTLHNKVVYHAMKALNAPEFGLRWPVLRFNFRGTGLSDGAHDGKAEAGDVQAALHWLESEFKRPIILAGFSFGAAMALLACCGSDVRSQIASQIHAVVALGLPTQAEGHVYRYSFLSRCSLPKLFLSGERDQFASAADLQRVAATTAAPKKLVLVPGADHFFSGQLVTMQNELVGWLKEQQTCLL